MIHNKTINLPLSLTLIRLAASPVIVPFLLVYLLPYHMFLCNVVCAVSFISFALTDFFDGYFARRYAQETMWGRLLDPLADKFLIYSILISLLALQELYFFWVILFIGRDFFVMGMRTIAQECGISVSVSYLAKIKTAVQMFFLLAYMLCFGMTGTAIDMFRYGCLYSALILSLVTALQYHIFVLRSMRSGDTIEQ